MTTPLARLVQVQKAMGHPVRLRLLAMLRGGPLCVCQMTVVVKLAASTVSEHLSELRKAGLVVERKDGRWVEYRLSDSALQRGLPRSDLAGAGRRWRSPRRRGAPEGAAARAGR